MSFFQSFDIIMNVVEMLQKQFQDSATSLQSVQREYSKMLADRQTLDSQLNENRQVRGERWRCRKSCTQILNLFLIMTSLGLSILFPVLYLPLLQVKEELDLADESTKVFKLIGPALVNQDLSEAKSNVEKRIEYIRQVDL